MGTLGHIMCPKFRPEQEWKKFGKLGELKKESCHFIGESMHFRRKKENIQSELRSYKKIEKRMSVVRTPTSGVWEVGGNFGARTLPQIYSEYITITRRD